MVSRSQYWFTLFGHTQWITLDLGAIFKLPAKEKTQVSHRKAKKKKAFLVSTGVVPCFCGCSLLLPTRRLNQWQPGLGFSDTPRGFFLASRAKEELQRLCSKEGKQDYQAGRFFSGFCFEESPVSSGPTPTSWVYGMFFPLLTPNNVAPPLFCFFSEFEESNLDLHPTSWDIACSL